MTCEPQETDKISSDVTMRLTLRERLALESLLDKASKYDAIKDDLDAAVGDKIKTEQIIRDHNAVYSISKKFKVADHHENWKQEE